MEIKESLLKVTTSIYHAKLASFSAAVLLYLYVFFSFSQIVEDKRCQVPNLGSGNLVFSVISIHILDCSNFDQIFPTLSS